MTMVGGLRHRMIKASLAAMLRGSLDQLGWFDTGRDNAPVIFRTVPVHASEEIDLNTAVLSTEDWATTGGELGSNFGEFSWTSYVDFYAESDGVGQHFIGDVYDILSGRLAAAGRTTTSFPVYDYRQATPPVVFYCDIEEVIIDRAHDFPKKWQRHWFACRFFIIDAYDDDGSFDPTLPPPSPPPIIIDGGSP